MEPHTQPAYILRDACCHCLRAGWRYDGLMCPASAQQGPLWECPLLLRPPDHMPDAPGTASSSSTQRQQVIDNSSSTRQPAVFSASVGTPPSLYWLGSSAAGQAGCFDMASALGPLPLDLGDTLYAPNVMQVRGCC